MGLTPQNNVIIAGVDESEESWAAAEWAAVEAERRHAALRLMHAYQLPIYGIGTAAIVPTDLIAQVEDISRAVLQKAVAAVSGGHPGLQVEAELEEGPAATVLINGGEHALMTVVGARGVHREFLDVLLGSVAARVAEHSSSPVVVIRSDATAVERTGPVVVGLDGGPVSAAALAFAFDEAAIRGSRLMAVHSWDDRPFSHYSRVYPLEVDAHLIDDEENRLLAEQLAGWDEKYPDVEVERVVSRGRPAEALVAAGTAAGASLLVVGTRGRGAAKALMLGSTSRDVLTHADRPVAVVGAVR